jgi:hypothetical protein
MSIIEDCGPSVQPAQLARQEKQTAIHLSEQR